jgi:ribosome-associated protein
MEKDFSPEFEFIVSRSSGPGGQNVNKVSTKVMLCFNVSKSALLSDEEKGMITEKLTNKINAEGILKIVSQRERSQLGNKELCIEKFYILITKALTKPKKRKKSKPTELSIMKRLEKKKRISRIKQVRKKIDEI